MCIRDRLWSIQIELPEGVFDPVATRQSFDADHQRQFGHTQPGGTIEITGLRVTALGLIERTAPKARASVKNSPTPIAERRVSTDQKNDWAVTPVYSGADLTPGFEKSGPLLIEELTTTVYVGPNDRLIVDHGDNFVIDLEMPND